jgi:hypothetical protein
MPVAIEPMAADRSREAPSDVAFATISLFVSSSCAKSHSGEEMTLENCSTVELRWY